MRHKRIDLQCIEVFVAFRVRHGVLLPEVDMGFRVLCDVRVEVAPAGTASGLREGASTTEAMKVGNDVLSILR